MSAVTKRETLADLARTSEKAELINGRIVFLMPTGVRPSEVASNIYVSLRGHSQKTGQGRAFNDNLGYGVPKLPSGRESFAPDASYYLFLLPADLMGFVQGPPTFAAEVRSEYDYGPADEAAIAFERDDYFLAGTQVVWDVDPRAETIACFRASAPTQAIVWRRGDVADAEPAVPGWRIPVDEVFA